MSDTKALYDHLQRAGTPSQKLAAISACHSVSEIVAAVANWPTESEKVVAWLKLHPQPEADPVAAFKAAWDATPAAPEEPAEVPQETPAPASEPAPVASIPTAIPETTTTDEAPGTTSAGTTEEAAPKSTNGSRRR